MESKRPTYGNGKICYLVIPADDIEISSGFYNKAFGWKLRTGGDGHVGFDDGVGEVSGMWVKGKKPMTEEGIVITIMVDSTEVTSKLITDHGGKILSSMKTDAGEKIVHFTDPAGNIMGLYQSKKIKS